MEVFWVAVGSMAAVLAAIAALIPVLKPLRSRLSRSERQRAIEAAEEAAERFDYWMKNYNHQGNLSDKQRLVGWLVADGGHAKVGDDYSVFVRTAKSLHHRGYKTLPAPTESEFTSALSRAKQQRS